MQGCWADTLVFVWELCAAGAVPAGFRSGCSQPAGEEGCVAASSQPDEVAKQ